MRIERDETFLRRATEVVAIVAAVTDEAPRRAPLVELAIGGVYLIGIGAALTLIERALGSSPLAFAIAGAVIAEVVATRAGVRWKDGLASTKLVDLARAAGQGAAPIAVACALVVVVARVLGVADVAAGAPTTALVFALLRAVAVGVRDELFYRGLPLAAVERAGAPRAAAIAFGALAGAAPLALAPGATPAALALEVTAGLAFALLWSWGPVAAVAAHATWALLIGAGLHGALLDVAFTDGALTSGPHASGAPALIAIGALAVVSAYAYARLRGRAPAAGRA